MAVAAFAVPIGAEAGENAGHSLADKFAHESGGATRVSTDEDALRLKLEAEERLKADEADMLERAKAEAEERRQANDVSDDKAARERATREKARIKQAAEKLRLAHEKDDTDRRAAEAEKQRLADERAAAERKAAEAEKARLAEAAEAERRANEAEKVRLAREAEEVERKRLAEAAETERRAKEAEKVRLAREAEEAERKRLAEAAEADRRAKEAEKVRLAREAEEAEHKRLAAAKVEAERRATADAHKRIEEASRADAQRRMEAEREDEARRLSEKLARAREQREAAKNLGSGYSALGNPPARADDPASSPDRSDVQVRAAARGAEADEPRATLLLVMKPGTRGIRRYEKTADPIVCLGETCYVGSGADVAAAKMTRGRALGPGNTLGQRAGACRHSLTCIFRDVDVSAGHFEVQPVDLRLLRHDRRETVSTQADRTCTVSGGQLRCGHPIEAGSYRIWVVPESVAKRAGVNALWSAVADGLPSATAADLRR